jgi:glycine cleavage system aminomethyltransferase T
LTVADVANLPVGAATLSVFTTESGGIIDDTIITNKGDHVYVVVNAGCFDKDYAHIMSQLDKFKKQGHQVDIQLLSNDYSLLALQGIYLSILYSKNSKAKWNLDLFVFRKSVLKINIRSLRRDCALQVDLRRRCLVEVHDRQAHQDCWR